VKDLEPLKKEIVQICKKNSVALAYLLGSQAKNKTTLLSDIDIAVLFDKTVSPKKYSNSQVKLTNIFMGLFETNDIDISILNISTPLFKFNAISGKLLYAASSKDKIHFEVAARKECFDTQKIRSAQYKALAARHL